MHSTLALSIRGRLDPLFRVRPGAVLRFVTRQPVSFWLLNFYMFLEYVRPQSIWTSLSVFPWSQVAILGTLGAMALEGRFPRLPTVASGLLVAFCGVVLLSSVMAVDPSESYERFPLFFNWVLLYVLVVNLVNTERRFFVFMLAFLLYSFKMSQHGFRGWVGNGFSFADEGVTGAPGWFQNSGEFGIQMCVFLPLMVEFILAFRRHWGRVTRYIAYFVPVTILGSIVASSSRGAVVGAAAVLLWWIPRSKHRVRATFLVLVLSVLTWTVMPGEQRARFATAGSDGTSISRLERWEAGLEMAREYPVLGIGFGNWSAYYGPLSHNIFIEAVSELGYVGLLSFVSLIVATFWLNYRTRKLLRRVPTSTPFLWHMAHGLDGALVGFLVSGFFVTVLYYPYFWANLAMTAALHTVVRREYSRGSRRDPVLLRRARHSGAPPGVPPAARPAVLAR